MPTLVGEKRVGNSRAKQGNDGLVVYEEDYHFLVRADSINQSRREILLSTDGLPRANNTVYQGMMCTSVNLEKKQENQLYYDAVCTFSSEVKENTDPSTPQQGDPTVWIPVGDVEFEPLEEVVRKDVDGKAWVNSANKPFETGLIIPRRIASVTFTQFETVASASLDEIMGRSDRVNEATYKTWPKNTLLLMVDRATIGYYYGVRCWRIQYTMKLDDKEPLPSQPDTGGWTIHQLDAGYHYYDAAELKPFEDDGDPPGPFVGLLDGSGGKVADQKNGDPVFLPFKIYKKLNFKSFLRI